MEKAGIPEMVALLAGISRHYEGKSDLITDFDEIAAENLADIFGDMEMYYSSGDGMDHRNGDELWALFDYLFEAFGGESDFAVNEPEMQNLFDLLKKKEAGDD